MPINTNLSSVAQTENTNNLFLENAATACKYAGISMIALGATGMMYYGRHCDPTAISNYGISALIFNCHGIEKSLIFNGIFPAVATIAAVKAMDAMQRIFK